MRTRLVSVCQVGKAGPMDKSCFASFLPVNLLDKARHPPVDVGRECALDSIACLQFGVSQRHYLGMNISAETGFKVVG